MLVPSIFNDSLFDDFVSFFDFPQTRKAPAARPAHLMRTDVKETAAGYEIAVELPGFKKDEVKVSLKDGTLTIAAEKNVVENEETGARYLHRERYTGALSRAFYVGKDIEQTEIRAKFEDGVLILDLPKIDEKKRVESTTIQID